MTKHAKNLFLVKTLIREKRSKQIKQCELCRILFDQQEKGNRKRESNMKAHVMIQAVGWV